MEQVICPDGFVFNSVTDSMVDTTITTIDKNHPPTYTITIDDKQFSIPRPIFRNFLLFHEFTADQCDNRYSSVFSQSAIQEDTDNKLFSIEDYVEEFFTVMIPNIKHFVTVTGRSQVYICGACPSSILLDDAHPDFERELDYIQKNFPQVPIDFFTRNLILA